MAQIALDAVSNDHLRTVIGKKWSTFPDCIGAFIAEMDFGTAPEIKQVLHDVVEDGFFGYLPEHLVARLQQATATWYRDEYSWDIPEARIHPLPDVLAGLQLTIEHYANANAKIIVTTPAYMPFLMVEQIWNRQKVEVPMIRGEDRWDFDFDALEAAYAANPGSILIVCNPYNPVGRILEREEMERIAAIVDAHGGRVFSDEIHAPIRYGKPHIPYASINEVAANHTITTTSASKAWNLPGLKCAELILSNDLDIETWNAGAAFAAHGASSFGVAANVAAFEVGKPWLNEVLAYLDGNRHLLKDLLATHLPDAHYVVPEGTYLAFIGLEAYGKGDDLSTYFREHAKVAVTNGADCGEVGAGSIRFNLAMSRANVEAAVEAMAHALNA
jgi:cystathionine beta-lyase